MMNFVHEGAATNLFTLTVIVAFHTLKLMLYMQVFDHVELFNVLTHDEKVSLAEVLVEGLDCLVQQRIFSCSS